MNKLLLLPILIAMALAGCSSDKVLVGDPEAFQMQGFKENKLRFSLTVPIENKRHQSFDIVLVDLHLRLNGAYLGHVTNTDTITIEAETSKKYSLPLQLQIKNLLAGAGLLTQSAALNKDAIGLEGFIKIKSGFISKKSE